MTHFDLCGCVRLPGSSNVHDELDVRHDWHGCPSSHLILRRRHRSQALLSLNRLSFKIELVLLPAAEVDDGFEVDVEGLASADCSSSLPFVSGIVQAMNSGKNAMARYR